MRCPVCACDNETPAKYCATCGCDLHAQPLECNHCHSANPQRSRYCRKCGQKIVLADAALSSTQRRQKAKALIQRLKVGK